MLHKLHRLSGLVVGLYVMMHLVNHLVALQGIERHIAFMESYRALYRVPVVEVLLLVCVLYQVGSGTYFVVRRWGKRRGFFEHLQALSGGYLAFFLLVHVSAVLYGRLVTRLDTNFFFAAAGLNVAPLHVFFVPYYALAIAAFVSHVVCALHYLSRNRCGAAIRNTIGYASVALGVVLALVIVATFSGMLYHVEIPEQYRATYL